MKKRHLLFILFGVLFALLGSYREYFFVNVNNIMTIMYYGQPTEMAIPDHLYFLSTLPYKTVYYLKYIFTIIYFLAFFILSYVCLKYLAPGSGLTKWLIYLYLLIVVLSGISMLWAYFVKVNLQDSEYTISRWLMGIAQSPLPVLFFLATAKLYPRSDSK
jgi:hypothetical protein